MRRCGRTRRPTESRLRGRWRLLAPLLSAARQGAGCFARAHRNPPPTRGRSATGRALLCGAVRWRRWAGCDAVVRSVSAWPALRFGACQQFENVGLREGGERRSDAPREMRATPLANGRSDAPPGEQQARPVR